MGYDPGAPRQGRLPANTGVIPHREAPLSTAFQYEGAIPRMVPPSAPEEEQGVEIWNLVGAIWRRKFLIIAIAVVGVGIGVALTLREKPQYRATTTLEVQASEVQILQGAVMDPGGAPDSEFMGTQTALLKSRALAERVAENLGLTAEPLYAPQEADPEVRLEIASSQVMAGLSVTPVRGARIIELGFRSTSPEETARIANAVAENYIEMNLERRYNATAYARKFLEERLATGKTSLEEAERRLVEYSRSEQILDLSSVGGSSIGSSLDASALVSLSGSLTQAQNDRIQLEQRYREAIDNPSTREMLESPALQALRKARSDLLTEYETQLTILRPEHPDMIAAKSRIAAVERDMDDERKSILRALETEYRAAAAQETALATRVEELKDQVTGLRIRSIDYNILNREVETLRAQYDALLQRLKEVSISSGVGSSRVSILDRAQAPVFPFEPNLQAALIRALGLSLAFGIALALLLEFLDDTIKSPEDVVSKLHLRVIGVVPKVRTKETVGKQLRNPRGVLSEAYSSARVALQFAMLADSMRSILVTGSRPGEGKTSTTLALGSSFAAIGKKVLIIDADLRRPSFVFKPGESAGLSGVLGQDLVLMDHVLPGDTANLFLLPSGPVPPNPAELLASTRLAQLIELAKEQFDVVLIDSPPVLTFADAPMLSAVCDGTVLIVQAGAVRRQIARRAVERLSTAHSAMVGVVLTKFDAKKAGYGQSYGYGYGYGDKSFGQNRLAFDTEGSRRQIKDFAGENNTRRDDLFDR
jgi:succinoglycan biosynthesis transport protein ExoP